ncbi:DUF4394 domain-containing protein [Kribbella italica]|uniref:DUF4394 domain-containing protein n=1 Tax=Kribbella italica TaxID=1540520 RepID=A0A7W9MTV8_9ACTN|nr:DUF4394 domain-containing protein [Kribbella italica]MBB5835545.1 hypothetical protein [Kribbella italica]
MRKFSAVLVALGLAATSGLVAVQPAAASSPRSGGASIYLLEASGSLSVRNAKLPLLTEHRVKVRGLKHGDRLVGIDTRPATKELYALGKSGQVYKVNGRTGQATAVGTPAAGAVGTAVGFDFNPTVDRIRVVTESGRNLRLHPDTGAVAGVDTPLAYASGSTPRVAASAYTDSFAGATTTGLYGLDANKNTLVTQGTLPGRTPAVSPNTGQLFSVGRLGFDFTAVNGFDIDGRARTTGSYDARDYTAIAAIRTSGLLSGTKLVKVDLRTGRATPLLALGLGDVVGLAFAAR